MHSVCLSLNQAKKQLGQYNLNLVKKWLIYPGVGEKERGWCLHCLNDVFTTEVVPFKWNGMKNVFKCESDKLLMTLITI